MTQASDSTNSARLSRNEIALQSEVEALRLANAALQEQLISGSDQTERMLLQLETQRNELQGAQQKQHALMAFIQRVIDSVDSLVIVLGPNGRIKKFNQRSAETLDGLQVSPDQRTLDEWLHPAEAAQLHEALPPLPWPVHSALFESIRRCKHFSAELRLRDGAPPEAYRHFLLQAQRLYDERGKEEGAVISATDITTLKQLTDHLEDRVNERTAELAAAMAHLTENEKLATLGGLVAGMAHEVSTPIGNTRLVAAAVAADLEKMKQDFDGQTLRRSDLSAFLLRCDDACQVFETNTRRASDLIASFKQVAVDETSMRRRNFRLDELISETLRAIGPAFKHQPVSITATIPESIPLDTFPGALEQVLINLVTNSVKHAIPDDRPLQINIRAALLHVEGQLLCELSISDDGLGMDERVAAQAFDRFFSTKIGKGGSGLGLYLVKNLITQVLGGSVNMESAPDRGTRFIIVIPTTAPEAGGISSPA